MQDPLSQPAEPWTLYVLLSADHRRTYVGITNDLPRRLEQHNGELPGGAKSTRGGRPWSIGVTHGPFSTRAEAQQLEYQLKQRRGAKRLAPLEIDERV